MKTLVVTHVYELALPYLSDLFASVNEQTDTEFDFVVFNYGLSKPLSSFGFSGVEVKNEWAYGIPDARDWAMKYAVENDYDLAVFIDADDSMSADRVSRSKSCHLKNKGVYGFYYTKLYIMGDPEVDFFSGELPENITTFKTVEFSNCVGLSNFAINVKACKDVIRKLKVPKTVIAYDWYFTSLLLVNDINGCLVDTKTYYRIYQQNTAGKTSTLDLKTIRRTIDVKRAHFTALLDYFNSQAVFNEELYSLLVSNVEKYIRLSEVCQFSESINQVEITSQLNLNKNAHWWSII